MWSRKKPCSEIQAKKGSFLILINNRLEVKALLVTVYNGKSRPALLKGLFKKMLMN